LEPTTQSLGLLHQVCLDAARTLEFDKSHPWHLTLVTLYGSILELAGCVILLAKPDGYAGLGSVFRTLLETYVDFAILVDDRSYGRVMDAEDAHQMRKIYRRAQETDNPYLLPLRSHPKFAEEVARLDAEIEGFKNAGVKRIGIEQRFHRAGASELYDGLYRFLSVHAHSNRSALVQRHLETVGDGEFGVFLYMPRPEKELLPFLDSTARTLVDATNQVFKALKIDMPSDLRMVFDRLAPVSGGVE
jgi:hypothetical protein